MIAQKETVLDVSGTLDGAGTKFDMGIDLAAVPHLMNVLTDLYKDHEKAVIREYSTNALDSHVAAGQTRPIEVSLPSHLSPFFKVQDYGIGMNLADIRDTYSRYGASTKRETNEQVGTLGLGCKAALTYTNQFTLVGIKDGVRTTVAITRDDGGGGSMRVVDEAKTDDENGVEIVVPAKTGHAFERKAKEFFQFWAPGTVLVNGESPQRPEYLDVTKNVKVIDTSKLASGDHPYGNSSQNVIVMGNVAYPAPLLQTKLSYRHRIVAFVEIGDVSFTPSREELRDASNTKAALTKIEKEFSDNIGAAIQKTIDAEPDKYSALLKMLEWRAAVSHNIGLDSLTYKGEKIPTEYKGDQHEFTVVPASYYKLSEHRSTDKVNIESFPNTIWFHNYDRANFTAGQRKKLNKWLEDHDEIDAYPSNFVLMNKKPKHSWIDPSTVYDWTDVQAIKLPRAAPSALSGRIAGSYDWWTKGTDDRPVMSYGKPADDIDTKNPVYYLVGSKYGGSEISALILKTEPDATVVVFNETRKNKFKRNFPMAKDAREDIDKRFEKWQKGISKLDKAALALSNAYRSNSLSSIDPSKVNDPELKAQIKLANRDISKLQQEIRQWRNLGKVYVSDADPPDNIFDKYPLFDSYKMRTPETAKHIYLYLEAAYAARKKEDQ